MASLIGTACLGNTLRLPRIKLLGMMPSPHDPFLWGAASEGAGGEIASFVTAGKRRSSKKVFRGAQGSSILPGKPEIVEVWKRNPTRRNGGGVQPARQGELAGCSVWFARAGCVQLGSGLQLHCRAEPPRSGPLSTLASLSSYLLRFPFCGQGLSYLHALPPFPSLLLC